MTIRCNENTGKLAYVTVQKLWNKSYLTDAFGFSISSYFPLHVSGFFSALTSDLSLCIFTQTLWCWAGRYGSDAADGDPQLRQQHPGVSERAAAAGPLLRRLRGRQGTRLQGQRDVSFGLKRLWNSPESRTVCCWLLHSCAGLIGVGGICLKISVIDPSVTYQLIDSLVIPSSP